MPLDVTPSKDVMSVLRIANALHRHATWPSRKRGRKDPLHLLHTWWARGVTGCPPSTSPLGSTPVRPKPRVTDRGGTVPYDRTCPMQHPDGIVDETRTFQAVRGEFASHSWRRSFHRGDPTPSWGRRPQYRTKWHVHVDGWERFRRRATRDVMQCKHHFVRVPETVRVERSGRRDHGLPPGKHVETSLRDARPGRDAWLAQCAWRGVQDDPTSRARSKFDQPARCSG